MKPICCEKEMEKRELSPELVQFINSWADKINAHSQIMLRLLK